MMNEVATVHQHILQSLQFGNIQICIQRKMSFSTNEALHLHRGITWCALMMLLDLFRNHKIAASHLIRRGDSGRVPLFCYKITILLTAGIFEADKDTGRQR